MHSLPWRYSSPCTDILNIHFWNFLFTSRANLGLFIIIYRASWAFMPLFLSIMPLSPEIITLRAIPVHREGVGHLEAKIEMAFPESLPIKYLIDEHSHLHDCKECCSKTYFPPWPVKYLGLPPAVCRHQCYTHQSNIACMAKLQQEHQEQGKISVSEVQHQIKGEIQGEEKDYSSAGSWGAPVTHTSWELLCAFGFN